MHISQALCVLQVPWLKIYSPWPWNTSLAIWLKLNVRWISSLYNSVGSVAGVYFFGWWVSASPHLPNQLQFYKGDDSVLEYVNPKQELQGKPDISFISSQALQFVFQSSEKGSCLPSFPIVSLILKRIRKNFSQCKLQAF